VQVAAFLSAVLDKTATADDKARSFPLAAGDCRQALVVVPKTTLDNWQRELQTWGFFRVRCFHGGSKEKDAALRAARERECEVVLTTYSLVLRDLADLRSIEWDVTVWDEVHTIKNEKSATHKACMQVPCKRRFGLTGTPMSNDYKEVRRHDPEPPVCTALPLRPRPHVACVRHHGSCGCSSTSCPMTALAL
jgi:SNF2 family DNA or RNA helicase